MAASKQEASQRLKTLIADGRKLATFLRGGVRQQYGNPGRRSWSNWTSSPCAPGPGRPLRARAPSRPR